MSPNRLAGVDKRIAVGAVAVLAVLALVVQLLTNGDDPLPVEAGPVDSGSIEAGSVEAAESTTTTTSLVDTDTTSSPQPVLELDSFAAAVPESPQLSMFAKLSDEQVQEMRRRASKDRPLDVGCGNAVAVNPPAADLRAVVAGAEPGTCFRLAPGTYTFSDVRPKDYMTFVGTDRDDVILQGTSSTENAFSGTATGVNIGRMSIVGFQGSAGEKRQEQAAIRGTRAVWASDRGQMATEWLIEDVAIRDSYATGVLLGDNFTVRGSVFSGNGVTGIAGNEIQGGLVIDNEITGNGFASESEAYLANGAGMKFVQSGAAGNPLVVARNKVHNNSKIGIWCDIGCNGFHVVDNYVYDYGGTAIVFEISTNARIVGNYITHTESMPRREWDFSVTGLTVRESSNVVVEDNYIDGAHLGLNVKQTKRPALPEEEFLYRYDNVNFVLSDITVRDNQVSNVRVSGVDITSSGKGIARLDTVRFIDNTYDDVNAMVFRWDEQRKMSFSQWQSSNRDAGGGNGVDGPPEWPPPPRDSYVNLDG